MRTNLVGLLVLLLATCSGWCTRLHAHEGRQHDHGAAAAAAGDLPSDNAEGPRPVNDDNCACAGALPGFSAAMPTPAPLVPLPFDHPFAIAAGPLTAAVAIAAGMPSAPDPRLAGHPLAPTLRASRLNC